jgi:hypothetical protein
MAHQEEPPPFLGSWKRVYTAVVIYLIAVIVSLWIFSRSFRP